MEQEKNKKIGDCWIWPGYKMPSGYGELRVDGKNWLAHRYFWTITHGPITNGLWVLHKCDNPSCFRPDHLFLGTNSDNILDCSQKGRHNNKRKTHCPRGHVYDKSNTIILKRDRRDCRTCAQRRTQAWKSDNKERVNLMARLRYKKNKII